MAQYDGSIRINTEIEAKRAEKELKSLESSIEKTAGEIASLRSKMDALKDVKTPTSEYRKLQNELDKIIQKYNEVSDVVKTFEENGADKDFLPFKQARAEAQDLYIKIEDIRSEMFNLEETGKAFTLGTDTDKYAQMSAKMQQLNQQMESDTERQAELQSQIAEREEHLAGLRDNAVVGNQRIIETVERIKQLEQEIADLKAAGVTEGYEDYDSRTRELLELKQEIKDYNNGINEVKEQYWQLSSTAANSLKQLGKSISRYAITPFKLLGNIAKNAFSNIGKGSKSSNGILNGGLKNILKYGLGIRSLYVAFNKLRSAINEGFSNLYNDRNMSVFKNQVDSLKASILTFKNAFAAAFRPIVEIAIPYIQRLTDYMINLMEVISQFVAAITGQKKYTKAIKQTTAAIEDENKAQNKQLSGLDKLNNLTSGGGATGNSANSETMFEEVPFGDKFKDISQWIKDMWESADFSDLGELIGEKLKSALDSIPWENIKKSARKIGSSIATLINGGIEVPGLGYSIGNTLAQAINIGFKFLNSFVHELHWDSIGTFIANTLNGFFENIDWGLIRDTFITGVKGLAGSINSFIDGFNWDNISDAISGFVDIVAESIYEFFSTIHWEELGQELGSQITATVEKIDWEQVGKAIGSVIQAALDFFVGFVDRLEFEEAAQAVIDALKGAFETVDMGQLTGTILALLAANIAIKATASIFAEAGKAILKALGKAILSASSTISVSKIASGILTGIGTAWSSLGGLSGILTTDLGTIMAAGTATEIGVTIGTGILGALIGVIGGGIIGKGLDNYILGPIISFFDKDLGNYYKNFKWFGEGGFFDFFSNVSIEEALRGVSEWAKDSNSQLGILIKTKEKLEESGFELSGWAEYSTGVIGSLEKITEWDGFSKWWDDKVSPWFTKEKWEKLFQNIKDSATEKLKEIKSWWDSDAFPWVTDALENLKSAIKSPINGIIDIAEKLANSIVKAINSVITSLNGISFDIPDWLKYVPGASSIAGKTFGLNIPKLGQVSIPRLATGAVIPANREFLAVLGDQKHGTNIEAPVDTIKQAQKESLLEVLSELGITGGGNRDQTIDLNLTVECEGYQLLHLIQKLNSEYFKQTGRHAFT